jgi:hypothetical protein
LDPFVAQAEGLGVYAVLLGGVLSAAATGLISSIPAYLGLTVGVTLAAYSFARWRRRRVSRGAVPTGPSTGGIPVALAALSLFAYTVVLGVVHTHYFTHLSGTWERRLSTAADRAEADTRTVQHAEHGADTSLATALVIARRFDDDLRHPGHVPTLAAEESQMRSTVPHLTVIARSVSTALRNELTAEDALSAVEGRRPMPTVLPPWFGRLQSTFQLAAQILAALILALVFSRHRSSLRSVNALFRIALMIALLGLLAACVGSLPSVSSTLLAILLGYTLAGVLSSGSAVALIAGDWVR